MDESKWLTGLRPYSAVAGGDQSRPCVDSMSKIWGKREVQGQAPSPHAVRRMQVIGLVPGVESWQAETRSTLPFHKDYQTEFT